jgi:segregation and condensation protein A
LRRGHFSFEEAVQGEDRMTVAVTVFALLELYKRGEAWWEQGESFGEIAVHAVAAATPLRGTPSRAQAGEPLQAHAGGLAG